MKITIYTITDCQFSAQEKEYLKAHSLTFEEKNLETNREFLTEMLTVSNNFAGTPVTKIEKDDGQIAVLKGFTKEEFDKELGLATVSPSSVPDMSANVASAAPVVPPVETPAATPPPVATPPPMNTDMNTGAPAAPPMASADAAPTLTPLSSPVEPAPVAPVAPDMTQTLDKLSGMGTTPAQPAPVEPAPMTPPPPMDTMTPPPAQPDLNNVLGNLEQKSTTSPAPAVPGVPSNTPPTVN